jgi:hypothetical protein
MKLYSFAKWAARQAASFFVLPVPRAHSIPPERMAMATMPRPPLTERDTGYVWRLGDPIPPERPSTASFPGLRAPLDLTQADRAHRTLVEETEEAKRRRAAVRTLEDAGYSWRGGVLWRPPLGEPPADCRPLNYAHADTLRANRLCLAIEFAVSIENPDGLEWLRSWNEGDASAEDELNNWRNSRR